jgi:hypothetical protein
LSPDLPQELRVKVTTPTGEVGTAEGEEMNMREALDPPSWNKQQLQLKVRALTAHVNRSRLEFERVIITLDPDETRTLARTLYKELMEVINVVEEAK